MERARADTDEVANLADELRELIWMSARQLRAESHTASDLSLAQQAALAHVVRTGGGLTAAELARLERVRPQSMSTTVAFLRDQGSIEARRGAGDARRVELWPTEAGAQELAAVREQRSEWLERRLRLRLDVARRERLAGALPALRDVMEDPPEP